MRKMESLDRTLIDFLTYLLIFTCFFAGTAMLAQSLTGAQAGFHWYLSIVGSALAYTYLYYDGRLPARILPFLKTRNTLDRIIIPILFLPVLLPIFLPADFPTTEHKYWIGSYILISFLLNIRHVGIYAHDIMAGFARYLFLGMAVFVTLVYLLMPPKHLNAVLPTNAIYLIVILTVTVLLLHLLRLDRRTESFVKKELMLLVLVLALVSVLYLSGIIGLVEQAIQTVMVRIEDLLSAFLRLFSFTSNNPPDRIGETVATIEVTTAEMTYTTYFMTGDVPMTTAEEKPIELKPVNYWLFLLPILLLTLLSIYLLTKKSFKKEGLDLFVEERVSLADEERKKRKKKKSVFAAKTPTERVRASYRRFMKVLEHPADTSTNLKQYTMGNHGDAKVQSAEKLTDTYRKARYIDNYPVAEEAARDAERQAKRVEEK